MPSNQCTTTLMELGFAVGNMAGAERCDQADYRQLEDILAAWQCRDTGDVSKLRGTFVEVVQAAQAECEGGECPAHFCVDTWKLFNSLIREVQPSELEGQTMRGPIPPKVKGPPGIARTRRAHVPAFVPDKPKGDDEGQLSLREGQSRYGVSPSRGMGYGDEERRKRWYPSQV